MRRIHRRNRDLQQEAPAALCARCGGELYRGCPCWELAGARWCEACLVRAVLEELSPFRVRWEEAPV